MWVTNILAIKVTHGPICNPHGWFALYGESVKNPKVKVQFGSENPEELPKVGDTVSVEVFTRGPIREGNHLGFIHGKV